MRKSNNLFLIGFMGTGKTTLGRQLAKKLLMTFYDSDHEIEQHTGVDIPLIFEIEGEVGFRKRESQTIAELVKLDNIVLSTGGGAILKQENRDHLSENGFIIYLKSTPEKLYKKTADDIRRPLLKCKDKLMQIKNILNEREPIYRSLANEIVDTDGLTIKQILRVICNLIKNHEENRS